MQKHPNEYYIAGIASGNSVVLLEIYDAFLPLVKKFVQKENGSITDAEDVFNQALMQLYARLKTKHIDIKSTFEGYLFTTCKNLWRRELNKKSKMRVTNDEVLEHKVITTEDDDAIFEEEAQWELFEEKFQALSDNCKNVLKLHLQKLSAREIMGKLNYASETTVRQRIFKCKSSLIKKIRSDVRFKNHVL